MDYVFRNFCKSCSINAFNRLSQVVFEKAFEQNKEEVMAITTDSLKRKTLITLTNDFTYTLAPRLLRPRGHRRTTTTTDEGRTETI